MQRLFTMFPGGRVGVALVCLRLSAVVALALGAESARPLADGVALVAMAIGLALCIGLATPICASVCCLAAVYHASYSTGAASLCLVISALNAFALALLGPGAYSIDARLYGRRRVVFKHAEGERVDPPDD